MAFCSWESGEIYKNHFKTGIYACNECGAGLFSSQQKFEHQSPWPAFTQPITPNSVSKRLESPGAFKVYCSKCKNPLGHEFVKDGPNQKSRF